MSTWGGNERFCLWLFLTDYNNPICLARHFLQHPFPTFPPLLHVVDWLHVCQIRRMSFTTDIKSSRPAFCLAGLVYDINFLLVQFHDQFHLICMPRRSAFSTKALTCHCLCIQIFAELTTYVTTWLYRVYFIWLYSYMYLIPYIWTPTCIWFPTSVLLHVVHYLHMYSYM